MSESRKQVELDEKQCELRLWRDMLKQEDGALMERNFRLTDNMDGLEPEAVELERERIKRDRQKIAEAFTHLELEERLQYYMRRDHFLMTELSKLKKEQWSLDDKKRHFYACKKSLEDDERRKIRDQLNRDIAAYNERKSFLVSEKLEMDKLLSQAKAELFAFRANRGKETEKKNPPAPLVSSVDADYDDFDHSDEEEVKDNEKGKEERGEASISQSER